MADDIMTHMPFMQIHDGRVRYFCCTAELGSQVWRVHLKQSGGRYTRIPTHLPAGTTECAPIFEAGPHGVRLSFIGTPDHRTLDSFALYALDAPSLGELVAGQSERTEVRKTRSGFYGLAGGCWWDYTPKRNILVTYEDDETQVVLKATDISVLNRISYVPDRPGVLLFSGLTKGGELFVQTYNLRDGSQHDIICDGLAAYKCAILGARVDYTVRVGEDFEDRRIQTARTVEYRACNRIQRVQ